LKQDLTLHDITVVLTSCGRLNELARTLSAFHAHYKPGRFILMEDKADQSIFDLCADKYPHIEVVMNKSQLGQMSSIDKAYSMVSSKHIMHLEDDREAAGSNNIADCLAYLDKDESLSGICLNNMVDVPVKYHKYDIHIHGETTFYWMQINSHPEWFGYTFNPSILRKSIWDEYGPFKPYISEETLSLKMKKLGRSVAYVTPGHFQHIGYDSHVDDPMQKKRKRGFWGRLKRSLEKRVNRVKRRFEA
jgi:hypothetical protein